MQNETDYQQAFTSRRSCSDRIAIEPKHLGQCEAAREPQIARAMARLEKQINRQTELVNQLLVRISPIRLQPPGNVKDNFIDPQPSVPRPPAAPLAEKLDDLIREVEILNDAVGIATSQIEL